MFTNVFIPIFLFGMLVFIHELGHFTVAKLCNVFVERFSIGFGPALFKKKFGETEYAICAFPLGGYVKMRGEELPETEEERKVFESDPRSFAVQNVWKRIAIVIMGPTSNFLLPIVLFTILFMFGIPAPSSKIGSVVPGSVAEEAGLFPGDTITKINGREVHAWSDLTKIIHERGNQDTEIVFVRDGNPNTIHVTPTIGEDRNEYGETVQAGKLGIEIVSYKPVIGVSQPSSDAFKAGFRTGDTVEFVGSTPVTYWWQFVHELYKQPGDKTLTVLRGEKKEMLPIKNFKSLETFGIENGELFINKVMEKSIASENGLIPGDKIHSINGVVLANWANFRDQVQQNRGETMALGLIRAGKVVNVTITPEEVEQRNDVTKEKKKVRQLGVLSEAGTYPIDYYQERYTNIFSAFGHGVTETLSLTKQTFVGLGKLATGKLGMNSLGGPISIFYMAGTSYESGGWNSFFRLMAILSITLAALNILPIPVLDGGHLFFFVIEAIKGSPVSMKIRQYAMQAGFYALMALMVLVFYVDINRFFVDKIKAMFN